MKLPFIQYLLPGVVAAVLFSACASGKDGVNKLSKMEKQEGWTLLFNGKTLDGWHVYNKGKAQSAWIVQDGELYCRPGVTDVEHGDLLTDQEYENFELAFEWKISKEGNSGVFINVQEKASIPTAWASGPEYQLLEQTHHDYATSEKKRPGCLYGFAPQKNPVEPRPAGMWNQARIRQMNGKIEFYLNGVLTAEEDFKSPEWTEKVANSGFKSFPEFGKHTKGRIALQDWAKGIAFRNIKINLSPES